MSGGGEVRVVVEAKENARMENVCASLQRHGRYRSALE